MIEIDGGYPQLRGDKDTERTAWPESQGFRVVRSWNDQVLCEPEAVQDTILNALQRDLP